MRRKGPVKVYSTPNCPGCTVAKRLLGRMKVAFEEINVQKDPNAKIEMLLKSGQSGVPVLDIAGTIVVGFNQGLIEAAIRKNYASSLQNL